jgi:hypothetical protein
LDITVDEKFFKHVNSVYLKFFFHLFSEFT